MKRTPIKLLTIAEIEDRITDLKMLIEDVLNKPSVIKISNRKETSIVLKVSTMNKLELYHFKHLTYTATYNAKMRIHRLEKELEKRKQLASAIKNDDL